MRLIKKKNKTVGFFYQEDKGNQILDLPDELDFGNKDDEINDEVNKQEEEQIDDEDQPVTLKMLYSSILKVKSK